MGKYIKLFEDYENELKNASDETSRTWTDIRDAVQMRLPFVIIVFKNSEEYLSALDSELIGSDYIKQKALMSKNGKLVKYPSIFMIVQDDESFKNKIPKIFNAFKTKVIFLGKKGEDQIECYYADGSSVNAGNEIVSSLEKDEMDNNDHFEIGSTNYRFIDFAG
jgi:hypothetical protein